MDTCPTPPFNRDTLDALPLASTFADAVASAGHAPLRASGISVLQINVGKRCNQACRHCHVDAGPDRTEVMPPQVVPGSSCGGTTIV